MLRARHCQFCLDSIPATRRIDALYCRDSCKTLASHARKETRACRPAPTRQQPSALVELVMRLEAQEAAARSELAVMRVRIAELEALIQGGQSDTGACRESSIPQTAVRRGSGRFKKRGMKPAVSLLRTEAPAKDLQPGSVADNLLRTGGPAESSPRGDRADNLPQRTFVAAEDSPRVDHTENLPPCTTGATKNLQGEDAADKALRDAVSAPTKDPRGVDHVEALLRTDASARNPQRVHHIENLLRAATPAKEPQRATRTDGARSAPQTSPQPATAPEDRRSLIQAPAPPATLHTTLHTPTARQAALIVPRRVNEHDAEQRRMQSKAQTGNTSAAKTAPPQLRSLVTATSPRKEPAALAVPEVHRSTQPAPLSAPAHAASRELWPHSGPRKTPAVEGRASNKTGQDEPVDHVSQLLRESPQKDPVLRSFPKLADHIGRLLREQSTEEDE